jgi:hypothetical protein
LGELLPHSRKTFDKFTDLLWKDVKIGKKRVTIHLKNPKISSGWGDHVTLFAVPCKLFCPVQWVKKLRAVLGNNGLAEKSLPVFRIKGGGGLSQGIFLKVVKSALATMGECSGEISGKSFRSGIPSELNLFPEDFKERHLKALGRWKSSAYQIYIRKEIPEKKTTQRIIASSLIKNFFAQVSD